MISILGSYQGTSGYAKHTSNLALACSKFTTIGAASLNGHGFQTKHLSRDELYDNLVCITTPPFWDLFSASKYNFNGFLIYEGDKLPQFWVDVLNKGYIKRVLVPSVFCQDLVERAKFCKADIDLIPHGFNPEVFSTVGNKMEMNQKRGLNFGFAGGWAQGKNDRKGLQYLLEAYCTAFDNKDDVALNIKLNMAYQSREMVDESLKTLNLPELNKRPAMSLYMGEFTDNQMAEFYRAQDLMVYPSKGEAFNMPALESMACGVPNMVTNWGGHLDYVNSQNGWLIDYTLEPYSGNDYLYEEVNLATPSSEHLVKLLRDIYENRGQIEDKKRLIDVKDRTWAESAKKLVGIIEH